MAALESMKVSSDLADQRNSDALQDLKTRLTEQHRLLLDENATLLNVRLVEEHAALARLSTLLRVGMAAAPPPGLTHPLLDAPVCRGLGTTPPSGALSHMHPASRERPLPPTPTCCLRTPPSVQMSACGPSRTTPYQPTRSCTSTRGGFSEAAHGGFAKRAPASEGATTPGTRSTSNSPGPSSRGLWSMSSAPTSGGSSRTSSPGLSSRCSLPATPQVANSGANTPVPATTVIMRRIPNSCTRDLLLSLMDRAGFAGAYDLVYLPHDLTTRDAMGYAFVNFTTEDNASRFSEHFQGFSDWSLNSKKTCDVQLSSELQGLEAHVARYRNSALMHDSIPDEFKPAIFADGNRIEFPPPTKPIKKLRLRASRKKKSVGRFASDIVSDKPVLSEPDEF